MNEFVEQFVIEGRELVAQGTDDLLALEEHPDDRERIDGAFRAFHTLKGAAGIVDFDAMGRALHAAEDVLSAVRSGSAPVTSLLVDLCLACLDQVGVWIDQMAASGSIPAGAEVAADDIVRRFTELAGSHPSAPLGEGRPATAADGGLSIASRRILEAQKLLLGEQSAETAAGRLGSVSRVAANVLRHHGLDTTNLEGLLQTSLLAGDAASMAAAIDQILDALQGRPPEPPGTLPEQAPDTTLRVEVGGSTGSFA